MFRVMIVDDEIYVVALIKKLIDWDKFQMVVETTANDGVTALELARETKPDLVIVDVRMPGYDGISFMDKVREFNSRVRFIVISGHKQFDYAKGALRNNVEDYLLKPINKDELEQVIAGVRQKLLAERQTEDKLKEMEEALESNKERVRRQLVEALLKKEEVNLNVSLAEINRNYETKFEAGQFMMAALILDAPMSDTLTQDNNLLLREWYQQLQQALADCCADVLIFTSKHVSTFLINYTESQKEKVEEQLQYAMKEGREKGNKFENLTFRICQSLPSDSLDTIQAAVQSLNRCLLARTAMPEGRITRAEDIKESEVFLEAVLEYRGEWLRQALQGLNAGEISRSIREMYSKAFYGIEEDTLLYYKLYVAIVDQIYVHFSNIDICKESQPEFRDKFLRLYLTAAGAKEYPRILCREAERMIGENQLSGELRGVPAIRIVKRYIRAHYREDISLSALAEMVNISPVYLSRLFKKEEGINFLDYLNQCRIEEARNLLRDIQLNINDISELSGFHNTKYFSKIFKKSVGITPSEYRRRHLGKEDV